MFNFIYNAKNIKDTIFFVNNNNFITKKKNVIVSHNKLLKIFVDFRSSLLVKIFKIKLYVIHYFIKLSFNFFLSLEDCF